MKDVPDLIQENKIDSTTALEILIHFEGLTNVSEYMQTNFKLTYEDLLKINLSTEIVDALIMRYIYTRVIIDTSKLNGMLHGPTLNNLIQDMKKNNTLYTGGKSKQRRKKNKNKNKKTKKRN